jgi:hypothetical protein
LVRLDPPLLAGLVRQNLGRPWVQRLIVFRIARLVRWSITTARPVALSIMTLSGFRFRWTTPRRCAHRSARATS